MSTLSEQARAASKSKAERMVRADPRARVDASGYVPDGAMDADVQTGERPISRRAFRTGGKVAGEAAEMRADRKPRATGGRALTADSYVNRDVKAANQERDGIKHVGGFKKGGRIGKTMGGLALPAWADAVSRATGGRTGHAAGCECAKCGGGRVGKAGGGETKGLITPTMKRVSDEEMGAHIKATHPTGAKMTGGGSKLHLNDGSTWEQSGGGRGDWERSDRKAGGRTARATGGAINDGTRPVGGRLARKGGGRTKKGTNVNIIITQPPQRAPMPMPPPGMPPPGAPPGLRQGVPPPAAAMPPPGPGAAPPPMMGRATGGRTNDGMLAKPGKYPIESGAGGGLGRLEKARAART